MSSTGREPLWRKAVVIEDPNDPLLPEERFLLGREFWVRNLFPDVVYLQSPFGGDAMPELAYEVNIVDRLGRQYHIRKDRLELLSRGVEDWTNEVEIISLEELMGGDTHVH